MSRGNVSYKHTGETTEWEDILLAKGIVNKHQVYSAKGLDYRDFEPKDEPPIPEDEDKITVMNNKTVDELEDMEDDFDDDDDIEERFLEEYRQQRINELKQQRMNERFGGVTEISKADWLVEVNEASNAAYVVVHLYQDHVLACRVLDEVLLQVAAKFKAVKFLKIRSTAAVENWPDERLPTLFVYHDGELKDQLITLAPLGGSGSLTPDDLEWWLAERKIVETELEENPRTNRSNIQFGSIMRR